LSDFFEPPAAKPAAAKPQRYRMPPWFGAPRATLPGVVAFERVLAMTDKVRFSRPRARRRACSP